MSPRLALPSLLLLAALLRADTAEQAYRAIEDRFFAAKLGGDEAWRPAEVKAAKEVRADLRRLDADGLPPRAHLDRDLLAWYVDRRLAYMRLDAAVPGAPADGPQAARPPPDDAWRRFEARMKWDFGVDYGPAGLLDRAIEAWDRTEEDLAATCGRIDPDLPWREVLKRLGADHPEADELLGVAREQMERAERLRANNVHWTRCVALHETIPGHHLQFAVAREKASRVERLFYNSAFVEGWGLYCEGMMAANGYFADPRDRASQLAMRLWRSARAIIDLGTHLAGMTKEEAVGLLVDGVGMEPCCARDEVDRYVEAPLYYSGYLVGCLEIEALRREAERRDGSRFDQRSFHDALLAHGPLPFRFVRRAVLAGN